MHNTEKWQLITDILFLPGISAGISVNDGIDAASEKMAGNIFGDEQK